MTTKIINIELTDIPKEVSGLVGYEHAYILFRYKGRPVNRSIVPVKNDQIDAETLGDVIQKGADWSLWNHMLSDYLELARKSTNNEPATIAICTRDRTKHLQRCIESLLNLYDDGQELLVIDNHPSSDATFNLVKEYDQVRYAREDRRGLNNARNRALKEASFDIVAFIDDDAVPDPAWLRFLLRNFDDPLVLCTTGMTIPYELETEAQEWFERYSTFNRGFVRKTFDYTNLSPHLSGHAGAGVNMALRKSVVNLVGPFDEALDAGTPSLSGGDNEMFSRILARGYRIVYEPEAINYHCHRRTWRELRQTLYGYGVGVYAAWTRSLLRDREFSVLWAAWKWFQLTQLPTLVRSLLLMDGSIPFSLILSEIFGCIKGPWAYIDSRNQVSYRNQHK